MKSLVTRTITVLILVPVVFAVILLMPWLHHLAINLICIVVSTLGAFETAHFFASRGLPVNGKLFPMAGGLLPLITYLEVAGFVPSGTILPCLVAIVAIILAREIFVSRAADFEKILPRIASSVAVVIYPGLFLSYVVRFSSLNTGGMTLVVFLLIVFANDVVAYLAGSFLGSGSRGLLPVSPNKSLVGFVGGLLGALLFAYLCWLVFPSVFAGSLALALGIGAGVGILTIIGDLIESAMKRSSGLKDSGAIIPGRGGVLDSIDSILFASPLCYYLLVVAGGG